MRLPLSLAFIAFSAFAQNALACDYSANLNYELDPLMVSFMNMPEFKCESAKGSVKIEFNHDSFGGGCSSTIAAWVVLAESGKSQKFYGYDKYTSQTINDAGELESHEIVNPNPASIWLKFSQRKHKLTLRFRHDASPADAHEVVLDWKRRKGANRSDDQEYDFKTVTGTFKSPVKGAKPIKMNCLAVP